MSKKTSKLASEVREHAVRMVFDHERDHPSRWAAVVSIAEKIGCVPQTLNEWLGDSYDKALANQRLLKGRGYPSPRTLAFLQGRGIRDPRMGRLVQQPSDAGVHGNTPPTETEERYYAMLDDQPMAA